MPADRGASGEGRASLRASRWLTRPDPDAVTAVITQSSARAIVFDHDVPGWPASHPVHPGQTR